MIQKTYSLYNGYDPDSDREISQNLVLISGGYYDRMPGRFVNLDKLMKSNSVGGYDPDTCRFISQNPVMDGVNWYAYCHNNPIKYTDPDGYFVPLVIAGIYIAPAVVTATTVTAGIITGFIAGVIYNDFIKPQEASKDKDKSNSGKQDKKLTDGEIKDLKDAGYDVHKLKGKTNASKKDLYKKPNGDVVVKPKGGAGEGDPTGINLNDL